jgi:hypothetical protein
MGRTEAERIGMTPLIIGDEDIARKQKAFVERYAAERDISFEAAQALVTVEYLLRASTVSGVDVHFFEEKHPVIMRIFGIGPIDAAIYLHETEKTRKFVKDSGGTESA